MRAGILSLLENLQGIAIPFHKAEGDGDLLVAYCRQQDETAFAELVRRHAPLVFGVCRRVLRHTADAEDAFQATFVLLARHAAGLDPRRPLANWLYAVAYRTSLKAKSWRDRRRKVDNMVRTRPTDSEPSPEPELDRQELGTLLDQELLAIPAADRELILLCDLEGWPHRQVAEALHIPPGSVSRRLSSVREQLRLRLARRGVVLTAVALGVLLAETAAVAVPPALTAAAVRTALTSAIAAPASGSVAQLAASVQRDTALVKFKMGLAAVFVVAVAVGAGFLFIPSGPDANASAQEPVRFAPTPPVDAKKESPKKEADRGQTLNGLSLGLSADKTELAPGSDGKIEPLTLRLQFHNESNDTIRIKTDNLLPTWEGRVTLNVIGPDGKNVGPEEEPGAKPVEKPKTGFFHPLSAGKSKLAGECKFPGPLPHGAEGKMHVYSLNKPGKYRVRASYTNIDQAPFSLPGGVWTGTVTSNELVITVRPAAQPNQK
jgi:RNA polymerase sigma factor (sigma-70 family)